MAHPIVRCIPSDVGTTRLYHVSDELILASLRAPRLLPHCCPPHKGDATSHQPTAPCFRKPRSQAAAMKWQTPGCGCRWTGGAVDGPGRLAVGDGVIPRTVGRAGDGRRRRGCGRRRDRLELTGWAGTGSSRPDGGGKDCWPAGQGGRVVVVVCRSGPGQVGRSAGAGWVVGEDGPGSAGCSGPGPRSPAGGRRVVVVPAGWSVGGLGRAGTWSVGAGADRAVGRWWPGRGWRSAGGSGGGGGLAGVSSGTSCCWLYAAIAMTWGLMRVSSVTVPGPGRSAAGGVSRPAAGCALWGRSRGPALPLPTTSSYSNFGTAKSRSNGFLWLL